MSVDFASNSSSVSPEPDKAHDSNFTTWQLKRQRNYFETRRQFHEFHRYFVSWVIPVYLIFGLCGTVLCLVVLIRTKRRMHTPQITHWFIALSLSDLYVLVLGLLLMYVTRLHYFVNVPPIEPRWWNAFSCYSINALIYFGLLFSTWVQAGISVLRALSTCMPLTVRVHLSSWRSLVCLGTTGVVCLLTSTLMILLGMRYEKEENSNRYRCRMPENGASQAFFYLSLILKVVLPWILLVLASASILSSLVRYQRSFSDCASTSGVRETSNLCRMRPISECSTTSSIQRRIRRGSSTNGNVCRQRTTDSILETGRVRIDSASRKRFQQKRISYVLLGMNFSFLSFNLPFEIWKIYYERNPPDFDRPAPFIINVFLNIIVYTNNATNWLFYFMLGRKFRTQVRRLLSSFLVCRRKRSSEIARPQILSRSRQYRV